MMFRTTVSRIRKVCSVALVPRFMRDDFCIAPASYVVRKAHKSTKSTDDGSTTEKTPEFLSHIDNTSGIPLTQRERCKKIIEKAFGTGEEEPEPILNQQYFSNKVNIEDTKREIQDAEDKIKYEQLNMVDNEITPDNRECGIFKMSRELIKDDEEEEEILVEENATANANPAESIGEKEAAGAAAAEAALAALTEKKTAVNEKQADERHIFTDSRDMRESELNAKDLDLITQSENQTLDEQYEALLADNEEMFRDEVDDATTNKMTTAKEEKEKLAQKLETIEETPLVEAQKSAIEGFNVTPRVLGDQHNKPIVNSCTVQHKQDSYRKVDLPGALDEVAKRCLKGPLGQVDDMLLKEMEKLENPVTCKTANKAFSPLMGDELVDQVTVCSEQLKKQEIFSNNAVSEQQQQQPQDVNNFYEGPGSKYHMISDARLLPDLNEIAEEAALLEAERELDEENEPQPDKSKKEVKHDTKDNTTPTKLSFERTVETDEEEIEGYHSLLPTYERNMNQDVNKEIHEHRPNAFEFPPISIHSGTALMKSGEDDKDLTTATSRPAVNTTINPAFNPAIYPTFYHAYDNPIYNPMNLNPAQVNQPYTRNHAARGKTRIKENVQMNYKNTNYNTNFGRVRGTSHYETINQPSVASHYGKIKQPSVASHYGTINQPSVAISATAEPQQRTLEEKEAEERNTLYSLDSSYAWSKQAEDPATKVKPTTETPFYEQIWQAQPQYQPTAMQNQATPNEGWFDVYNQATPNEGWFDVYKYMEKEASFFNNMPNANYNQSIGISWDQANFTQPWPNTLQSAENTQYNFNVTPEKVGASEELMKERSTEYSPNQANVTQPWPNTLQSPEKTQHNFNVQPDKVVFTEEMMEEQNMQYSSNEANYTQPWYNNLHSAEEYNLQYNQLPEKVVLPEELLKEHELNPYYVLTCNETCPISPGPSMSACRSVEDFVDTSETIYLKPNICESKLPKPTEAYHYEIKTNSDTLSPKIDVKNLLMQYENLTAAAKAKLNEIKNIVEPAQPNIDATKISCNYENLVAHAQEHTNDIRQINETMSQSTKPEIDATNLTAKTVAEMNKAQMNKAQLDEITKIKGPALSKLDHTKTFSNYENLAADAQAYINKVRQMKKTMSQSTQPKIDATKLSEKAAVQMKKAQLDEMTNIKAPAHPKIDATKLSSNNENLAADAQERTNKIEQMNKTMSQSTKPKIDATNLTAKTAIQMNKVQMNKVQLDEITKIKEPAQPKMDHTKTLSNYENLAADAQAYINKVRQMKKTMSQSTQPKIDATYLTSKAAVQMNKVQMNKTQMNKAQLDEIKNIKELAQPKIDAAKLSSNYKNLAADAQEQINKIRQMNKTTQPIDTTILAAKTKEQMNKAPLDEITKIKEPAQPKIDFTKRLSNYKNLAADAQEHINKIGLINKTMSQSIQSKIDTTNLSATTASVQINKAQLDEKAPAQPKIDAIKVSSNYENLAADAREHTKDLRQMKKTMSQSTQAETDATNLTAKTATQINKAQLNDITNIKEPAQPRMDASNRLSNYENLAADAQGHIKKIRRKNKTMSQSTQPKTTNEDVKVSHLSNITPAAAQFPNIPNADQLTLTQLLKKVRASNRMRCTGNRGVKVSTVKGKCPRPGPRCHPMAPRSPPLNPVPPPSFGLPMLKRRPPVCKPRPGTKGGCKKESCAACDLDVACGVHMGGICPEKACEIEKEPEVVKSKVVLTDVVLDRIQIFGELLGGVFQHVKSNVETLLAREYDPWSPIPSWPIPKKVEKQKSMPGIRGQPPCVQGCPVFPKARISMNPEPPCNLKPCEGFPKRRSFSSLDCFAGSSEDNKLYDLGQF